MKQKKGMIVLAVVALLVLGSIVGVMVGLTHSVEDLAVEMNINHVDAVLASADVKDDTIVSVPVLYYEQAKDDCAGIYGAKSVARQFEWSECRYYSRGVETKMTEAVLDENYLPVATGGKLLTNRGVKGEDFKRWFSEVEGKSRLVAGTLDFQYNADVVSFSYENKDFYPVGKDKLFTLNLGVPIKVMGEGKEIFEITADDDTWVYIDDKIVLDMGGIHGAVSARFAVYDNGEVYSAVGNESLAYSGIKLSKDENAIVRVFHANRDSGESVFKISFENTLLNIADTVLAWDGDVNNNATVAYNPDDPSYVAPLGRSLTTRPDKSRMILTSVTAQASVMVALIVVAAVVIFVGLRYWRRGHSRE